MNSHSSPRRAVGLRNQSPEFAPIAKIVQNLRVSRMLLIIEDQEAQRTALASLLRDDGYEVHEAETAAAALRCLEDHEIEIVIAEYSLPDATAPALVGQIRQIEKERARKESVVACILGSASLTVVDGVPVLDDHRAECLEVGIAGQFTKPIDMAKLVAFIEAHAPIR